MKKPKIGKAEQARMVKEYDELVTRAEQAGLKYPDMEPILGVRYECISKRRNGKQTVTKESILAFRMMLTDLEHTATPAEIAGFSEDMLS